MDDDAVLEAELRQAARLFDPPPDRARQAAEAAFTMRSVDAELATLTFDSRTAAGAVRAGSPGRLLTFTAGPVSIDVELVVDGEETGIIGRVDCSGPVRIDIRTPGRTVTVTTDDLGRFTSGPLGHGPVSLRCDLDPGIVTEWFPAH
ncbi:hypothetical protein ACRYCC_28165 [Actinomadura scrupuli]|uniref:hypothetical protein n=1 Tax=Actinomadura scrupuli TaxID=559629 RepID=UPI003D97D00A